MLHQCLMGPTLIAARHKESAKVFAIGKKIRLIINIYIFRKP